MSEITNVDRFAMLNAIMGMFGTNVVSPKEFHAQVGAVKSLLKDDITGVIDTLTDFSVDSACVDYTVESSNSNFTATLRKWTDFVNIGYNGKIPSGINALSEEYFKERWKYSSFPVLKIAKWEKIDGILLPTKMFFLDGGSIWAKEKDNNGELKIVDNYDYYIGKDFAKANLLDKDVLFTKSNGRWFDIYPTPFLIKRGVYHNYTILQLLKKHQVKVLNQIIPYLLLIKKGTEALAINKNIGYTSEELEGLITEFQGLVNQLATVDGQMSKSAIRATQFDEQIDHLIPDLDNIFKKELFVVAERNILSGLGFVDVVEGVSDTRKESILNPKSFLTEVKKGMNDFKQLLKDLFVLIKIKNEKNTTYMNSSIYIDSSNIQPFMSDKFMNQIRMLWDRGQISNRTYAEMVGEVEYKTEIHRREKELSNGTEVLMYPHQTRNDEGILSTEEEKRLDVKEDEDVNGRPLSDDKMDETQKQEYDISNVQLTGAPYDTIKELPKQVKDALSTELQSTFLSVFNNAYQQYNDETRAFRVAWGVIKKIAKKDKNGKWVKKENAKVTSSLVTASLNEEENMFIEEAMKLKEFEIQNKKSRLLDKILEDK